MRHAGPIPILDLCGRTDLHQLAALSAESDLLISNDTGPLHLAAAAGARVIGIYTCTDPASDRPVRPAGDDGSNRHLVQVQPDQDVQSHGLHGELTPDRVWPVVQEQIERANSAITKPSDIRPNYEDDLPLDAEEPI